MKRFFVHDAEGNILRTGSCSEGDLAMQAGEGETVVEGVADDATQKFVDGAFVAKPEPSDAEKMELTAVRIRIMREELLSESDWTQVPDSPLTAEKRTEWQDYRQRLRDLPAQYPDATSIDVVVFPETPA